jgi:hypothetical protein
VPARPELVGTGGGHGRRPAAAGGHRAGAWRAQRGQRQGRWPGAAAASSVRAHRGDAGALPGPLSAECRGGSSATSRWSQCQPRRRGPQPDPVLTERRADRRAGRVAAAPAGSAAASRRATSRPWSAWWRSSGRTPRTRSLRSRFLVWRAPCAPGGASGRRRRSRARWGRRCGRQPDPRPRPHPWPHRLRLRRRRPRGHRRLDRPGCA